MSAELIGKAMQNNAAYIELKRVEAAKRISEVIARSRNRVFLNSSTLMMNIADSMSERLCQTGSIDNIISGEQPKNK